MTKDDVERLETLDLPHPADAIARDLWLLSFYFAGMRCSSHLEDEFALKKRIAYLVSQCDG